MGFLKDLKDAANRGHEEAKQKIAKKEEERKKIEMLNEISRRRNESNKKNK